MGSILVDWKIGNPAIVNYWINYSKWSSKQAGITQHEQNLIFFWKKRPWNLVRTTSRGCVAATVAKPATAPAIAFSHCQFDCDIDADICNSKLLSGEPAISAAQLFPQLWNDGILISKPKSLTKCLRVRPTPKSSRDLVHSWWT